MARRNDRITNVGAGSEMNDSLDLILLQCLLDEIDIGQITSDEWAPFDRPLVTSAEIVQNNRFMTSLKQPLARVAADVTSSTSHQYSTHRV